MSNKSAIIDTETLIMDYKQNHPGEDDPTVIITSAKTIFGKVQNKVSIGGRSNWRGIIKNIRKRRETISSIKISAGVKEIMDAIDENIKRWTICENKK